MSSVARKTAIDKLTQSVGKILEDYAEDIQGSLDLITKQMGQKGAQALRQSSRDNLNKQTGEYAKGWTYAFRQTKRMKQGKTTIYNEHYSLPHLLEFGHVTRNGTDRTFPRTPAHPHIAPIAEALAEAYQREVIDKL